MKKAPIAFAMMLSVCGYASANDSYGYECRHSHSAEVREVEVVYLKRESSVPCEVNYSKDGVQENLWNASYTPGYCESKAKGFLDNLKGWGWECKLSQGVEPEVILTEEQLEKPQADHPMVK